MAIIGDFFPIATTFTENSQKLSIPDTEILKNS